MSKTIEMGYRSHNTSTCGFHIHVNRDAFGDTYEQQEEEYERRHNLLWPEMKEMIHEYGGKNYTIFLDKETLTLFGYIEIESEEKWAKSANTEICRKWWDYMADIMETNPDNSPISVDLKNVFHLD